MPSSEVLFDAWLNPTTLSRFMLPKLDMPNPKVSITAKVGGQFSIDMDVGDTIIPHSGEYLKIERPHTLSFTWLSPFAAENSVVTISFKSLSSNQTEVTLHHVKFPSEESRDNHNGGWTNILSVLDKLH